MYVWEVFIMSSTRKAYERRLEKFRHILLIWKSENEIFELYEKCHTPGQVISLFRYERSHLEDIVHLSDKQLIKMLRDVVPYSKDQHRRHLAMPQWWKIRFKYLDKSEEEVKLLATTQCQRGASSTHSIRRNKTHYNPKQTLEYWIAAGFLKEDAERKLLEFKRSSSPFTSEFWKKRGYSDDNARKKALSFHIMGGVAACSSLHNKFVSKLECDIFNQLQTRLLRPIKQQHSINKKFVYDICDLKSKKIIEVNGTYWHADPRVYSSDDMLVCNGLTASAVREKDFIKHEYAKNHGYEIFVIWEIDWHSNKEAAVQKMLEFLG